MTPHLIFPKLLVYTNIMLKFLPDSSAVGVGMNVALQSIADNFKNKDTEDKNGFNFPKDSVFVFNRPTIINLGDIDKVEVVDNSGGNDNQQRFKKVKKHKIMCKIFKVC